MRATTTLLLTIGSFAAGCSEFDLTSNPEGDGGAAPDILVDPPALTYGLLSTGEEEVQTFSVQNIGDATLNVSNIVMGSGIAFTILGPETVFDLEPGEETFVDVAFSPMGADENFGQALVISDDPDSPEVNVDLLGQGAVPELQITPDSYNFGETFVPCGSTVELELKNVGSEDLVITDLNYASAGLLVLDDSALRPQLPVTLRPNETTFVDVVFTPTTVGSDTGELEVTSNDPRGIVTADQNGEGSHAETNVESFTEPGVPPVDVMFLIDQSCSMADDNTDDIENGIPAFLAELALVSDWQLIQVTKATGCANGGVLDATTPNAESLLIDNAFNSTAFQHQYTEALLELASIALGETGPGGCNEGFLRPGALLHIIVASDEKEQSGTNYINWLADYTSYVSSQDFVKVSGILDLNQNCGDGTGAIGYEEAVDASGGSKLNICNANWGASFGDIASAVLAGSRTYNLSESADPNSITVTVNGVPTTNFSYTDAANSVTIEDEIGENDLVEITYGVLSEC